jgi:hypothetical protein
MNALTLEHFTSWMTEYGRASAENDPQASANLFAPDARYHENPFDELITGRDAIFQYWNNGAQKLKDKELAFEILSVENNRGIARWQFKFTVIESGKRLALACLFVAEFNDEGYAKPSASGGTFAKTSPRSRRSQTSA